jgi:hypothetical protein
MILSELPPVPVEQIVCKDCNSNEKYTLQFLQSRGINNKYAIATVMGNIKQESKFLTTICEGGARVSYNNCLSGGFGLIQWTTSNRYYGLGSFCSKYGLDPNSISGQLRYMVNESQWTKYEMVLKGHGYSVDHFMNHAYYWLGWGIHGNRTVYSHQYLDKFSFV